MLKTAIFNDGENFRHVICDLFANPHGVRFNAEEHLFDRDDYLPKQADWAGFFGHLVARSQIEGVPSRLVRAYWYVVGAIDPQPRLPKTERDAATRQRRYNSKSLKDWHARHARGIQGLVAHMHGLPRPRTEFSAALDGVEEILKELRFRKAAKEREFGGQADLQRAIVHKHRAIEFRRSGGIRYDLFTKQFGPEKTTDVNLAVDMALLKDSYDIAVIVSGDQDFVPAALAVKNFGKTVVNVAFKGKGGKLLPGGARRLNEAADWCVEVDYDSFRRFMFPGRESPAGGS